MKIIKRMSTALIAGLAFSTAMATEPAPTPESVLQSAFEAASALPAPARSLYIAASEKIAKDAFRNSDAVIIGELHHNTNYKFLADNPAFFREAAKNGVKTIYIELTTQFLPATEDYFAGRLQEDDFKIIITNHFKTVWLQWSGDAKDYAEQYVALCKTAKQSGLKVVPSDFRFGEDEAATSDIYGIPDIENRDDAVHALTLKTIKIYTDETGKARPVTTDDLIRFRKLYLELQGSLTDEEKQAWEAAKRARKTEWSKHNKSDDTLAAYQNELQARYIARSPHEKIIFIGGSRHFYQYNSIGDYARKNGYGHITGIELIAENGAIWRQGLEDAQSKASRLAGHQYQYRIRTNIGQIEYLGIPNQMLAKEKSPGF